MEVGKITTVLGDLEPEKLGFCHSHEHVSIAKGYSSQINPDLCIDDFDLTKQELESFYHIGGQALVDAQPVGCGRQADMIRELSFATEVSIIASTGFHKKQFYPENHWIFKYDESSLADIFTTELLNGMFIHCDDTEPQVKQQACAGQIKTALDSGEFDDQYKKLFSAAVKAANKTGAVVMIHVEKGGDPLALSRFLRNLGLHPSQMIFCHMDRMVSDLETHKILCAQGSYMEYDTIAREKYHDDKREVEILKEMISEGFEDQILLSLDVTRARILSYGGTVGLTYILKHFIPLLREHEISQKLVDRFFMDNPARAFAVRKDSAVTQND